MARIAERIEAGEQIMYCSKHHAGMAVLLARLGRPRPEGMTLSLVNWDSEFAYWGYSRRGGKRYAHRLSTSPDDYVWETQAENNARRKYDVSRPEVSGNRDTAGGEVRSTSVDSRTRLSADVQ
jgi:hypothetical protein